MAKEMEPHLRKLSAAKDTALSSPRLGAQTVLITSDRGGNESAPATRRGTWRVSAEPLEPLSSSTESYPRSTPA